MKKFLTLLIIAVVVITSCSKEETSVVSQVENIEIPINQNDPAVIKLTEMGYKLEAIKEFKDFYLVEGDIMINKKNLISSPTSRHAHTNSIVDINKVTNMTLKVDVSIPQNSRWLDAVIEAVTEWNNIPDCKVNFSIIPSNSTSNANIYIASDFGTLPETVPMAAAIPWSGNPGSQVKINLDNPNITTMSAAAKKRSIMHELGHIIGFLHTDGVSNPQNVGNNIIPTTSGLADPNSIMNSFLTSATGFSADDLIASKYLYPGQDIVGTQTYSININNLNYTILQGVKPFNPESFISFQSYIEIRLYYESGAPEKIYYRLINAGAGGDNENSANVFSALRTRKPIAVECSAFVDFRTGTDAKSYVSQNLDTPSNGIFSGYYSPRMTNVTFNYSVQQN